MLGFAHFLYIPARSERGLREDEDLKEISGNMRYGETYGRCFTGGCMGYPLLALLLFFILIFPVRCAAEDGVNPVWKEGDTWSVQVVYPVQGGGWSSPVLWEYSVSGVPGPNSNRYMLEVKGLRSAPRLEVRLTYRNNFSLAGVEIIRTLRGRNIVTALEYESGAPIQTEHTLTPCDTPVFPLCLPSSTDYYLIRRIDEELKIRKTVIQEVCQAREVEELPDWPEDRDLIEVKCHSEDGSLSFVQYWDENLPWPVYGWNGNMKYWLVRE